MKNIILNNVGIIIQGYATSEQQVQNLVDFYREVGFTKIIISSYMKYIPDKMLKNNNVVINDDLLKRDKLFRRHKAKAGRGLNFQIETTNRGIDKCLELYPDVKYLLKTRADQRLCKVDECISRWKKEVVGHNDNVFKGKILTLKYHTKWGKEPAWYINDYWAFGFTEDIKKYYDIPHEYGKIRRSEEYISSAYLSSILGKEYVYSNYKLLRDKYFTFNDSLVGYSYKNKGHYLGDEGYVFEG